MAESEVKNEQMGEGRQIKLSALYAFKMGMSTVYTENGEAVPVTVLKYEPWTVTQLKTKDRNGYEAVQIAQGEKALKNSTKSELGHLAPSGLKAGMRLLREVRQPLSSEVVLGAEVSIESLKKGDRIKLTGVSKGRGFAGSVRRFKFAGGPASHGSKFHRRPGSSGNRTWPGRVMPGKRFPGHLGDDTVTVKNVLVVDVLPSEGVVLVKGAVPGARNSLIRLARED